MEAFATVLLGVPATLMVTAGALLFGTLLAIPLTLGLESNSCVARVPCRVVVDISRGVPPVAWLFILYFGVSVDVIQLSALTAGIAALGIVGSAYLAEIFRGALKSLHHGQAEAATALGLPWRTTWLSVIAPQAWRTALPAYANYAIALLKDSSIVSLVGVSEIVNRAGQLSRSSSLGVFAFVLAGVVYIVLSVVLGIASRGLDQRLRRKVAV